MREPLDHRLDQVLAAVASLSSDDPDTVVWVVKEVRALAEHLTPDSRNDLLDLIGRRLRWSRDRVWSLTKLKLDEEIRWAVRSDPNPGQDSPRMEGEELYPTTGWFGDYLRWASGDEAPLAFHFWSAVAIIASLCRRNVYVDMDRFTVWLNAYIILVGDPASKKGQAMDMAASVLKSINRMLEAARVPDWQHIRLLPEKCSPERAYQIMASQKVQQILEDNRQRWTTTDAHAVWFVEELVMLLSSTAYNAAGIVEMLTAFYNCPDTPPRSGTIKRGTEELKNVSLTVLGAAAPSWFRGGITESMSQGGFISRVMFVHRPPSKKYLWRPELADPITRDALAERLLPILEWRSKVIRFTPEADEWGEEWYENDRAKEHFILEESHKFHAARRQIHMLKLAGILTVASGREEIDLETVKLSVALLDLEENHMLQFFGRIGAHTDAVAEDYVLNTIKRRGGQLIKKQITDLTKNKLGNVVNLNRTLWSLQAGGKLKKARTKTGAELWILVED